MTVKRLIPSSTGASDKHLLAATDHEMLEAVETLLRERPITPKLRTVLDRRDEARRRLRSAASPAGGGKSTTGA